MLGLLSPQSLAELTMIILRAELFEDVDAALRGDFADGVNRQAGPEAVVAGEADRVLFAMIDQHALGLDSLVVLQHVDDDARSLVLVLQVRRVDQDELIVLRGQIDLLFEDRDLVARVLVQARSRRRPARAGATSSGGMSLITSRDSSTFSASLALMQSQE